MSYIARMTKQQIKVYQMARKAAEGRSTENVKLHITGANDILIIKADSTFDGNDITAGIMPIRSQENNVQPI